MPDCLHLLNAPPTDSRNRILEILIEEIEPLREEVQRLEASRKPAQLQVTQASAKKKHP